MKTFSISDVLLRLSSQMLVWAASGPRAPPRKTREDNQLERVGQEGHNAFPATKIAATPPVWSILLGASSTQKPSPPGLFNLPQTTLHPSPALYFSSVRCCFTFRSQRESMERVMARIFQQNRNWAGEHGHGAVGGELSLRAFPSNASEKHTEFRLSVGITLKPFRFLYAALLPVHTQPMHGAVDLSCCTG